MFCRIFIKSENQERGKSEFHGVDGPIISVDQRIKLKLLMNFKMQLKNMEFQKLMILILEIILVWLFSSHRKKWF